MISEEAESFLTHLIELRDRLIRALLTFFASFLCLLPWASDIYDLLAHPMMAALPPGTKIIATGVITPFMVPIKVTLLVALVISYPSCFIRHGRS